MYLMYLQDLLAPPLQGCLCSRTIERQSEPCSLLHHYSLWLESLESLEHIHESRVVTLVMHDTVLMEALASHPAERVARATTNQQVNICIALGTCRPTKRGLPGRNLHLKTRELLLDRMVGSLKAAES